MASREKPSAVRAELDGSHGVAMFEWLRQWFSGLRVPNAGGFIGRACRYQRTVGTEICGLNRPLMLQDPAELRARAGIPDPRRMICGSAEDAQAIRTELGVTNPRSVTHRLGHQRARQGVPNSHAIIRRCGDNPVPVRAEPSGRNMAA